MTDAHGKTSDPNQSGTVPASDTKATEVQALNDVIAQRRLGLGIKPSADKPTQITAAMPARELSSEQIAAREEESKRMALAEQRARRQGMFAVLCDKAGERYADCSLGTFLVQNSKQQVAKEAAEIYAATVVERIALREGLVLYGPCGTGKDHLAFSVCRTAILNSGKSVGWINGQDWFGELRDEMADDGQPERRIIMRLCAPDLLVVSDPLPPVGPLTQYQATMFYRLIHARWRRSKPTLVTINVANDDEADSRLGVATWDRVCDGAWKVFCNWPSYRKPARIVNGK